MVTVDEIMKYRNVPPKIAAAFLDVGQAALYESLKRGIVPFGFAVMMSKRYSCHISPGLLIAYQNGTLQIKTEGNCVKTQN